MLDLTLSIVNSNHCALLRDCLRSIFDGTRLTRLQVIVVDHRSKDGSREMVRSEFPQVELIENDHEAGYSTNHNKALRQARGRYVGICNEDLRFYPGALDRLAAYMDGHPEVGSVGPRVLLPDGTVQLESGRRYPTLWSELCRITNLDRRFPQSRLFGGVNMGYWDHADTREVDCLTGACMIVRREIITQVGLMDEGFFMYGEDVDWPYRIRQAGWRIVYVAEAQVLHYGGQSNRRQPLRMTIEALRSQYRFFYKHYGSKYAAAYRLLVLGIEAGKQFVLLARWLVTREPGARAALWRHAQVFRWFLGDPARPVEAK
jgi:GT2 family glycosyltransferase